MGHLFERWKFFFAAAAWVIKLDVAVVADERQIIGVKESAVIGQFGKFVAVAEATSLVTNVAGDGDAFAGSQWMVEGVNRVNIARGGTH